MLRGGCFAWLLGNSNVWSRRWMVFSLVNMDIMHHSWNFYCTFINFVDFHFWHWQKENNLDISSFPPTKYGFDWINKCFSVLNIKSNINPRIDHRINPRKSITWEMSLKINICIYLCIWSPPALHYFVFYFLFYLRNNFCWRIQT